MGYGAMLTDANGVPFYIQDTMPLSLISVNTYANNSEPDIHPNDGAVRFVFCNSDNVDTNFYYFYKASTGSWAVNGLGPSGGVYRVYIFGYQFQPVPAYGIQINDAQGRCILTNETKVLRGVETIGTPGADSAGINLNVTIPGRYAVAPEMLGYISGVVYQGSQPYPYLNQIFTSAYYSGGNTVIKAVGRGETPGSTGASNITTTNYRKAIRAINVDRY